MNTLTKRQILIVRYLINTRKPLSSEMLAVILGATAKTIRADMDIINDVLQTAAGTQVISKTGFGYSLKILNHNEFNVFLQTFRSKWNILFRECCFHSDS